MNKRLILVPTSNMTRDEWLAYRMTGIGASEIGTLLGLDDYKSSIELFYEKIGEKPRFDIESMAAFMGREQEDFIAEMWQYWGGDQDSMIYNFRNDAIQRRCQRVNAYVRNPDYPWLFVSLDRKINKHENKGEGALEIKTIGGYEADKWEAGLPPKYVMQVQTQLLVGIFDYGEMAILQDGRKMSVLPFDRHKNIIKEIVARSKDFWDRIVHARKLVTEKYEAQRTYNLALVEDLQARIDSLAPEPDGTIAFTNYLKQKYAQPTYNDRPGTEEELKIAQQHLKLSERLKIAEEQKRKAENQLKTAMGTVETLTFGDAGKLYWTATSAGSRIFRNKVKLNP